MDKTLKFVEALNLASHMNQLKKEVEKTKQKTLVTIQRIALRQSELISKVMKLQT